MTPQTICLIAALACLGLIAIMGMIALFKEDDPPEFAWAVGIVLAIAGVVLFVASGVIPASK